MNPPVPEEIIFWIFVVIGASACLIHMAISDIRSYLRHRRESK